MTVSTRRVYRAIALDTKAPVESRLAALQTLDKPSRELLMRLCQPGIPPRLRLKAAQLLDELDTIKELKRSVREQEANQ